jgi:hypothetical protein
MNALNLINNFNILGLIKFGFLTVDILFIIFLLVVVRQVFSMNEIVSDANDTPIIKSSSLLLLIIAVSLFIVALVIL